jgi:predicted porin
MKKSLIALAVLAASGAAMAQSTVTLYGLIDVSVQSAKFATLNSTATAVTSVTQTRMQSGGQNGSRWGLKGVEDLGGGLNAVFDLQSGFNVDTGASGQGGLLFGRHAFVGLNSASFGTLTFGRHDTPLDDMIGSILPSGHNSFDVTAGPGVSATNAAAITAFSNAAVPTAAQTTAFVTAVNATLSNTYAWVGYNSRADNSIKYTTANYGGFTASALYALGENKTATVSATHTASLAAQYANGPITAVVAYQDEVLAKSAAGSVSLKNSLFGAAYDFGVVKLYGAYNEAKYTGVAKQKEYALGVTVPVGAVTLRAEAARSKGDFLGKSTGFDLEALYDLSKRSTVYTSFSTVKKEALLDERSRVFAVGLRHKF